MVFPVSAQILSEHHSAFVLTPQPHKDTGCLRILWSLCQTAELEINRTLENSQYKWKTVIPSNPSKRGSEQRDAPSEPQTTVGEILPLDILKTISTETLVGFFFCLK